MWVSRRNRLFPSTKGSVSLWVLIHVGSLVWDSLTVMFECWWKVFATAVRFRACEPSWTILCRICLFLVNALLAGLLESFLWGLFHLLSITNRTASHLPGGNSWAHAGTGEVLTAHSICVLIGDTKRHGRKSVGFPLPLPQKLHSIVTLSTIQGCCVMLEGTMMGTCPWGDEGPAGGVMLQVPSEGVL